MRREERSSVDLPVVEFPSAVSKDELHFLETQESKQGRFQQVNNLAFAYRTYRRTHRMTITSAKCRMRNSDGRVGSPYHVPEAPGTVQQIQLCE